MCFSSGQIGHNFLYFLVRSSGTETGHKKGAKLASGRRFPFLAGTILSIQATIKGLEITFTTLNYTFNRSSLRMKFCFRVLCGTPEAVLLFVNGGGGNLRAVSGAVCTTASLCGFSAWKLSLQRKTLCCSLQRPIASYVDFK